MVGKVCQDLALTSSGFKCSKLRSAGIIDYRSLEKVMIQVCHCHFDFLKDVRKLYWKAGVDNKPTVFLFTDTQVVEESFLEDINNILSSGEVPNLYNPEEFEEVCDILYCVYVCLSIPDCVCVCVCLSVCVCVCLCVQSI